MILCVRSETFTAQSLQPAVPDKRCSRADISSNIKLCDHGAEGVVSYSQHLPIQEWGYSWLELHEAHADEGDGQSVWASAGVEGSDYPDHRLLRCCGIERPKPTPPLLAKASYQLS